LLFPLIKIQMVERYMNNLIKRLVSGDTDV
jgi:hypothetical protein